MSFASVIWGERPVLKSGGAVSAKQTAPVGEKAWLALTAGCVDAVGYMVLWQVFTAHMSGNSVSAVVHAGAGKLAVAFHRAFPIPFFVLGVFVGAALSEAPARGGRPYIHKTQKNPNGVETNYFSGRWMAKEKRRPTKNPSTTPKSKRSTPYRMATKQAPRSPPAITVPRVRAPRLMA